MIITLETNLTLADWILTPSAALETIIFARTIWNIRLYPSKMFTKGENVTYVWCNQFQSEYIHSSMPNRCYIPKCNQALHLHSVQYKCHSNQAPWRTKWMSWQRKFDILSLKLTDSRDKHQVEDIGPVGCQSSDRGPWQATRKLLVS